MTPLFPPSSRHVAGRFACFSAVPKSLATWVLKVCFGKFVLVDKMRAKHEFSRAEGEATVLSEHPNTIAQNSAEPTPDLFLLN